MAHFESFLCGALFDSPAHLSPRNNSQTVRTDRHSMLNGTYSEIRDEGELKKNIFFLRYEENANLTQILNPL